MPPYWTAPFSFSAHPPLRGYPPATPPDFRFSLCYSFLHGDMCSESNDAADGHKSCEAARRDDAAGAAHSAAGGWRNSAEKL